MTDDRPTLREIAQAASTLHGGARGRELDRIAKRRGLTLSYTTVDKILNGTYTSRPKRSTLDALAQLAGIQKHVVYEAAGIPLPQRPFQEQLPPDVDELRPDQRRLLIDLARGLLTQNRREVELKNELAQLRERDGSGSAAPMKTAGGDPAGNQQDQKTPTASAAPVVGEQEGSSAGAVGDRGAAGGEELTADFFYGLAADARRTEGMAQRDAIDAAGQESQASDDEDGGA